MMASRFDWKTDGDGAYAVSTHPGLVREHNEDFYGVLPQIGFFMIADGMGGLSHGDAASRIAVETVLEAVQSQGDTAGDIESMRPLLYDAFLLAHDRIIRHGSEVCPGKIIGTTGVALWVRGDEALACHVGDSRLYRLRDRALEQITTDHTLVQEMVDLGRLTPEEAAQSPYAHKLTRALGVPKRFEPALRILDVRAGDVFLLCSDGLYGVVDQEMLAAVFATGPEHLGALAARLQEEALQGGGPDNITQILVRLGGA